VFDVIKSKCEERAAPLWRVGKDVRYRKKGSRFNYYGLDHTFRGLALSLKGSFQYRNAALALAALELLERKGYEIPGECVVRGLENTRWPGRMHTVSRNPRVILDGAHNPKAIRIVAESVRSEFTYDRLIVVLGAMEDKDIKGIVQGIVSIADYVIFTRAEYYRSAEPEVLMAHGRSLGIHCQAIPDLPGAITTAKGMAGADDLVLICGSLFIVGEALSHLDPKRFIPDGV
jgi:dihydrofolate synthase/folylpolyglutamate synthase